jgi:hypothetical protein
VDRPRKKLRANGYDIDTNDAACDYEIVDPTEDIKDEEEDQYVGEGPHLFITESERDSDSE